MPKFDVDVKAFISITVEAENEDQAREIADNYVEASLSPAEDEVEAWNSVSEQSGKIVSAGDWGVDGDSDVEPAWEGS